MNVSGSYNPYVTAYAKSQAGFRSVQRETPAASFADHLDKVTIPKEAREKTVEPKHEAPPAVEPETPSLVKAFLKSVFGDMEKKEELEKRMEDWEKKRMLDGPAEDDSQAKKDYTQFMDKLLGRGIIDGPKSLEERIKELTEKIKALQSKLGEVATNQSLPESTRSRQAEALTSQINALQAQLAKLAEGMSEEMTASAAEA